MFPCSPVSCSPLVQLGNCLQTDKLRDQHHGKKKTLPPLQQRNFQNRSFLTQSKGGNFSTKGCGASAACRYQSPWAGPWCIVIVLHALQKPLLLPFCFPELPSKQNAHSQKPTAFSTHCCDYAHRGELQTRWEKGLIHRTGMALNLNRLSCSGLLFGWKLLLLPFLVFQRCCPAGWDCWEVPGVSTLHAISVSSRTKLGLHGFWVLDHRFPWCWGVIRGNILTLRPQLLDAVLSSPVPTSNCVLVSAEQPVVEFTITNAACPLNEWEEAPWHNKSTRERAQMRLHSHKLPLYYTWSAFTIGSSKYDEERG